MKIQAQLSVSIAMNAPLLAMVLNPIASHMRTQRDACGLRGPSH
jgi:hypothetical protein